MAAAHRVLQAWLLSSTSLKHGLSIALSSTNAQHAEADFSDKLLCSPVTITQSLPGAAQHHTVLL